MNEAPVVDGGKARTGIAGLDQILAGGLARGRLFLIEGEPGAGKTTLALRYLMEGAREGERGLYVTLSETEEELRSGALSHGWRMGEEIDVIELVPPESLADPQRQQSLLYPSDLELGETVERIIEAIERVGPSRVVLDSLSEIRLLAQNSLRYRRQILALKHFLSRQKATVVLLDDMTADVRDKTVHSIAHGVIELGHVSPAYGAERRRLRVRKYRGHKYREGFHDFIIDTGGLEVFPRLIAAENRATQKRTALSSGVKALDMLLGGGVDSGSSTLILGPAGTGKSFVALTFAMAAIAHGGKAIVFVFDEELGLLIDRMKPLGIDLAAAQAKGDLQIRQIDAAELSPGEFSYLVRAAIEKEGIKTVIIDSLNGYVAAMPEEKSLTLHMHELLQYLNRQNATTFMTVAQHGLVGEMQTPVDITYLADTVILLRYFEAMGTVRRAASVIKKRSGRHEDSIREFRFDEEGFVFGDPLTDFQGVLRGVPDYVGAPGPLLESG